MTGRQPHDLVFGQYDRWGVHVDIRARRQGRLVAWSAVGPGTPMRDGVTAL